MRNKARNAAFHLGGDCTVTRTRVFDKPQMEHVRLQREATVNGKTELISEVASLYNLTSNSYRPVRIRDAPFCAGHIYGPTVRPFAAVLICGLHCAATSACAMPVAAIGCD